MPANSGASASTAAAVRLSKRRPTFPTARPPTAAPAAAACWLSGALASRPGCACGWKCSHHPPYAVGPGAAKDSSVSRPRRMFRLAVLSGLALILLGVAGAPAPAQDAIKGKHLRRLPDGRVVV